MLIYSPILGITADTLDDVEKTRIAMQNRYGQLTRSEPDEDGQVRGFGLSESSASVMSIKVLVDALKEQEKHATKILERTMKEHALGPWVKSQKGIGLKQGARLIAAVGDPYWNSLHDRPRSVQEFWAFCGLSVAPDGNAVRRKKGVKSNWNAKAKMRSFLIAESCLKQKGSPYELVYRARRAHTAVTRPDISLGQSHNDALRIASKEILKDLWIESKRLHEEMNEKIEDASLDKS